MRPAPLLTSLLLAAALAGCADEPEETLESGEDLAVDVAPLDANATVPPTLTDVLWLTPEERLNATAAANLTILGTLAGTFPQTFGWNTTFNGTGNLSAARLVLWLDLQNSAFQAGVGGDPGCSAHMVVYLTLDGTTTGQDGGCASIGTGMVPPGEHRLEFSTLLTALPDGALVAPGDGILVQVSFGLSLPQGVGYLLGGSDHDSHLRLTGLHEPVFPAPAAGNGTADDDADDRR